MSELEVFESDNDVKI